MTLKSAFDDGSVRIDASLVSSHISEDQVRDGVEKALEAAEGLHNKSGAGADFLGWLDPSQMIDGKELVRMRDVAARLREENDCLIVIGIGGSYLGARACHEALRSPLTKTRRLRYAGTNLSPRYHLDLLESVKDERYAINVISKSGTTTEPAIAFRIFRRELERRMGKDLAGTQIVATTDREKGALRALAQAEGWETFVIPDDVGGRFSVLTPVGLFPLAYAGINVDALIGGATECAIACSEKRIERNPALLYAITRHLLYECGLAIEMLVSFEPRYAEFVEWWKQLYGESEGKDGQGLFPAGAVYSKDLHSLGQWIQDGPRIIFETFLTIETAEPSMSIPEATGSGDVDGLSYLEGRDLSEINGLAQKATMVAHADGGCPNIEIITPKLDAYHLGALIYFFEYACAISGYMSGVNPFDQPGVEAYKRNMFALLGKPGYEDAAARLASRMDHGT
jgi:glucose-6-phosphate isomerase